MRNDFESNYLMHHGILGMKWGVRRYQNPDGSLTSAGKERYGSAQDKGDAKGKEKTSLSAEEVARRKQIAKNIAIGIVATGTVAGSLAIAYKTGALAAASDGIKKLYDKTHTKLTEEQLKSVVSDACRKTVQDIEASVPEIASKFEATGDKLVLKAGSTMHHITGKENFNLGDGSSDRLFTSFTDDDIAAYKALLNIRYESKGRYDIKLKAVQDLVLPNEARTNQIVGDLLQKPEFTNKLINSMTNFKMEGLGYKNVHGKTKEYKALRDMHRQRQVDAFNKMSDAEKIKQALWTVVRNDSTGETVKATFKNLGYNSLLDGNDKGLLADSPLILLDPKSSVIVTGKKVLSNNDVLDAANQIMNNQSHPAYKDAKDLIEKIIHYGGDLSKL